MTQKPSLNAPEDVRDSGIIDTAGMTALVLARPGHDLDPVHQGILARNLAPIPAKDVAEAQTIGALPHYALVETSMPGALEFVRKIAAPPRGCSVIALLAPGEDEAPAIEAGASSTLHRPVASVSVERIVERLQRHRLLLAESRELFERDAANALVSTTSRIAAAIAHEIRNPLAGARLSIDWLLKTPAAPLPDQEDALRDIDLALGRIDDTVSAIALLACGEAPHLERLVLYDVARDALANIANPRGVPVELRGDRALDGLAARKLLIQAIVNLVQNALDALKETSGAQVLVRVYPTHSEARVSVRDNGPGVATAVRDRVFEPFFSTKGKRGSGLGLAIARGAVASMGGSLTLSSQGPGACFRIRLRRS